MAGFTYKSYNFVDKDPIIDEVRALVEGMGASYKWVSNESGVSATTLYNWFDGTTKRPQAASVNAVLRSLGYKLAVVHDHQVVVTLVEAKPKQSMRHVVQMAKYKKGKKHG